MNYNQFSVWDVLVNILPGTVALILIATMTPSGYVLEKVSTLRPLGIAGLLGLIAVSYTVGWVFQALALRIDQKIVRLSSYTDPWKDIVQDGLDAIEDDEDNFRRKYLEASQEFFENNTNVNPFDDSSPINASQLEYLTYSYLHDTNTGRSYRFEILKVLSRSLYVLFGGAIVVHLLSWLMYLYWFGLEPVLSFWEQLILDVALLLGCYLMFRTRVYMEESKAKSMMTDLYVSELS